MLDVVSLRLVTLSPPRKRATVDVAGHQIDFETIGVYGDLKQVAYVLNKMADILDHGGQLLSNHLATSPIPARAEETHVLDESTQGEH